MQKILITEGTSSLAFKLKNLLQDKFEVVLGSSGEIPSILRDQFVSLPKVDAPTYTHEILKAALNNSIDFILPLAAKEISALSQSIVLFEEYGFRLLVSDATMFLNSQMMNEIPKGLDLVLLHDGVDLISGNKVEVFQNGLGILSDSGSDLILIVS